MKHIIYKTQGTCSRFIEIEANEQDEVVRANVVGGCNGNLKGICSLIKGMKLQDVHTRLKGIRCGDKTTSCPDQIAAAIEEMQKQNLIAGLKPDESMA